MKRGRSLVFGALVCGIPAIASTVAFGYTTGASRSEGRPYDGASVVKGVASYRLGTPRRADPWCGQPGVEDYIDYGHPDQQYSDPALYCTFSLGSYTSEVDQAIWHIQENGTECETIKSTLQSVADKTEWTGWYDQPDWNDARYYGERIGMHWPYMSDTQLWAHEGAHVSGWETENDANYWAAACTSM
jgi:hypothetical protein